MDRRKQIFLLILLLFVLFIINYRFLDGAVVRFFEERETGVVERVIDGDTIVVDTQGGHENPKEGQDLSRGRESVRLLGINSPERGEIGFEEAKEFLEDLILDEKVELEINGEDKYYRTLAYVHLGNKNVNIELVKKGFANYYFYSDGEKYSEDLIDAWEVCMGKGKNLCEASENVCAKCIYVEGKTIVNNCNFDCDVGGWQMHSEGRKKFVFSEEVIGSGEKVDFEIDLSNSGGSLFLRDGGGKLVVWKGH